MSSPPPPYTVASTVSDPTLEFVVDLSADNKLRPLGECADYHSTCAEWGNKGACNSAQNWMRLHCPRYGRRPGAADMSFTTYKS